MKSFLTYVYVYLTFFILSTCSTLLAQKTTAELITTISPPSVVDTIPIKDGDRYITYYKNYLFIVNYWVGIQIMDVSDVHSPKPVAFLRTKDITHQIDIQDDKLFIANGGEGVEMYDISDIRNPRQLATIKTPGDALWLDAAMPYLYVAMGADGFCIMDISNLNDPRTLSLEIPGTWIWSITHSENKLFVAAKQGGTIIYDDTNPSNLVRLAQYKTGYQSIQMQIDKNLAYIADGPGGLLILDISVPELPKMVARFSSSGFTRHVFKSGNYAYLSNREMGLLTVNVSDPSHPFLEAQYAPESETYCSYKHDVYVFLATDTKAEILRHNNQPVLEPLADMTIDENADFRLPLKASDQDGDALYFEAQNLPAGSAFDTRTGVFTWKPTFEQAGVYPGIIFTVIEETGSKLSDSDTISITVQQVNRRPELPPIANVSIPEDSTLIIQVPEGSDPDKEDAGKLTYHAENIPEGAEFDSVSRTFKWKPTFDQSGVYVVDFVLDDGAGGSDREAVTITVQHVDRAPVIQPIADQTVDENQPLVIKVQGSEPDKEDLNKITFSMRNLPQGASFDPATAEFSWTPTYEQAGSYPGITAIMKAGALSDTTRFSITVNHVNRPPVLAALADQTVNENELLKFKISGSDPDKEDAGKLTYEAQNLPQGATFNPDSLTFSWLPTYDQAGSYPNITFVVKDPQGLSDQKSIAITVVHVNRPPVLAAVPALVVDEAQPLEQRLSATDPDKEDAVKLVYSASGLPGGATLDGQTGVFNWTPTYDQAGQYPVTFAVSDGNLEDSKTTSITVNNVNRPPVLQPIADQVVNENQLLTFTTPGSDPDKEDGASLVYSAQNLPEGATYDPATQTFSWTPTFEQSGVYPGILFTVTDQNAASDQKSVSITVNHVNRAPQIEAVAAIAVDEMQPVSFALKGSDPDKEDAGKLVYSISNLPQGAALDAATGQFTWTPNYDQSGEYKLAAQVADPQGLTAATDVAITVNNVNRPPQVEPLAAVTGNENEPLTISLKFSDPDKQDAGKLSVTATSLPEGAALDASTGVITWTPTFEQSGEYTINYQVHDSFDATADGSVSIKIANVNRPPVAPEIAALTADENQPFSTVLAEGSDPDKEDAGKLQYDLQNLPQGATFNPQSRTLSWTPTFDQAGTYQMTYMVKDAGGLTAQSPVSLSVKNVNRPPVAPEIGNLQAAEGEKFSQALPEASDPDKEDAGKLQYEVKNLPNGASFSAATRTLEWIPGFEQAGKYNLALDVKDAEGASVSTPFNIEVKNTDRAPTMQEIAAQTVKEGNEISFNLKAGDPDKEDQPNLKYSAKNLPSGANFEPSSGSFNWTPGSDQQGEYEITFTVTDPEGLNASRIAKITVEDVPPPTP